MKFKSTIQTTFVAAGVLAAALYITGCEGSAQSEQTLADASLPDTKDVAKPASVIERSPNAMPNFALQDLEGNVVRLSDYAGKTVFVNFWATWCGPCKAELPDLVEIQNDLSEEAFVILGVSLDRAGPAMVRRFAEQAGLNFPILMGNEDVVIQYGNFQMIPTSFLLAPNHEKVKQYTGVVTKKQLAADIAEVMKG